MNTARADSSARGVLRVVKGQPDDEELAAVVLALTIVTSRTTQKAVPPPSRWRAPVPRGRLPRGPGGWRAALQA